MLTGPTPACAEGAGQARGMNAKDIDLFEINEAFAVGRDAPRATSSVPHDDVNVNGGAIAHGPSARRHRRMILGTLLDELERRNLHRPRHAVRRRRHGHRHDHRAV